MSRSAFTKNTSWLDPLCWLLPITAIGSDDWTITPLFSTPLLHRKFRLADTLLLCLKGNENMLDQNISLTKILPWHFHIKMYDMLSVSWIACWIQEDCTPIKRYIHSQTCGKPAKINHHPKFYTNSALKFLHLTDKANVTYASSMNVVPHLFWIQKNLLISKVCFNFH